jgi:O-antigen/teichoic acid export membrane protein
MINTLFGEEFKTSLMIYNILIFIIIISSISAVYGKVIYSVNLQNRLLLRSIIGIMINILCNYFFIKAYGVIGSASATIISLIFIELIYDFFDSELRPYHKFKLKSIIYYEK